MSIESLANIKGLGGLESVNPGSSEVDKLQNPDEFKDKLNSLLDTKSSEGVKEALENSKLEFSNHAVERMRSRGVSYGSETMSRIEAAIDKAANKGAKETLVLTEDSAMIVNVKNKKVVTVMDKQLLKENVFTNIDSTVLI